MALYGLSASTFLACLFFPLISSLFIEPYVLDVYGQTASMSHGNIVIMMIMMAVIMMFPLSFINYGRGVKVMDAYLGGANLHSSVRFLGSANRTEDVVFRNYYLKNLFDEARLSRWGAGCTGVCLAIMLVTAGSGSLAGHQPGGPAPAAVPAAHAVPAQPLSGPQPLHS